MKFKAYKEKAGTYFVNLYKKAGVQKGRRFENKLEADQFAMIETIQYHQHQLELAWLKLDDSATKHESGLPILEGYEHSTTLGDLLC